MEVLYPKYFDDFSCIAGRCPDSCCKEWSVDVDAQAAAMYRALPGELGERLRSVLHDIEDGTVMQIENGRCPMWQQDGLCRIHAELGHEALCQVCREFPRLRHDYGDFMELGLELSCPEAARLILAADCWKWVTKSIPGGEAPEYDTGVMEILRASRKQFLDFLQETTLPFPKVLAIFLLYAHEVQEEIDGGVSAILDPKRCLADAKDFAAKGDWQALQHFFAGLEILTPDWKSRLEAPAEPPVWSKRFPSLLGYFIGRYWLQAVSDFDVLCRAKLAVAACLLIGCLGGDLTETAQLFSKEIENDPDNMEAILDGAYTAPALTDTNLLRLLMGGI